MRAFFAVLLFCVLALGMSGRLMAAEIDVPNTQLLVNAARKATTGVYTDVTLTINGVPVVFTLFRDPVGNVTARPKAGQDTTKISTTQVNMQMVANAAGILTPVAMVVQGGAQSITKNMITFGADGSVASLDKPAAGAGDGSPVGGIGGTQDANKKPEPDVFARPFLNVASGGQLPLPAGAESGKISVWQP